VHNVTLKCESEARMRFG